MTVSAQINKFIRETSSNTGDPLRDTRDALNVAMARMEVMEYAVAAAFNESQITVTILEEIKSILQHIGETEGGKLSFVRNVCKDILEKYGDATRIQTPPAPEPINTRLLEALKTMLEIESYTMENDYPHGYSEAIEKVKTIIEEAEKTDIV